MPRKRKKSFRGPCEECGGMMKRMMGSNGACKNCGGHRRNGGGFYFLGFIGAVIYYIQTATGFWSGVLGILKAIVWPAFLVFELLKSLGA